MDTVKEDLEGKLSRTFPKVQEFGYEYLYSSTVDGRAKNTHSLDRVLLRTVPCQQSANEDIEDYFRKNDNVAGIHKNKEDF